MDTIQKVLLVVHTLIALTVIALVLLQRGKGADAGAAFGSGASGTVFGARGSASFFSRATAVLATAFFITSLGLAYISSQHSTAPKSLIEGAPAVETVPGTTDKNEAGSQSAEPAEPAKDGQAGDVPTFDELPAANSQKPSLPADSSDQPDNSQDSGQKN